MREDLLSSILMIAAIVVLFGVSIYLGVTIALSRRSLNVDTPLIHAGEVDCQPQNPENKMCPQCIEPMVPGVPCTGVVGAAQPPQGVTPLPDDQCAVGPLMATLSSVQNGRIDVPWDRTPVPETKYHVLTKEGDRSTSIGTIECSSQHIKAFAEGYVAVPDYGASEEWTPVCTATLTGSGSGPYFVHAVEQSPCFDPTDPIHSYGNQRMAQRLQLTDRAICGTPTEMGFLDKNGHCVPPGPGKGPNGAPNNNRKKGQTRALVINGMGGYRPANHPLQALHKVWGGGAAYPCENNNGVSQELVYVSPKAETIIMPNRARVKQRVLVMEMHGDLYRGDVKGVGKTKGPPSNTWPACAKVTRSSDVTRRVASIATTRDLYGPGVYNALCYVPRTDPVTIEKDDPRLTDEQKQAGWGSERKTVGVDDGRGYCFAAWTYHASEVYVEMDEGVMSPSQDPQYRSYRDFPCYSQCDGGANDGMKCPNPGESGWGTGRTNCGKHPTGYTVKDTFSSITHEIDFECPHNSPHADWLTSMTWDTMNYNTWVADINNYDSDTGSNYTQVAMKKPKETVEYSEDKIFALDVFPPTSAFDPLASPPTLTLAKTLFEGDDRQPTPGTVYDIALITQSNVVGSLTLADEQQSNDEESYTFHFDGASNFARPEPDLPPPPMWIKTSVKRTVEETDYISKARESDPNKDYHWYTLDWYVDPNGDVSKNYVAFYFNAPFDRTGQTVGPDGAKLPTEPRRKPDHITRRFVPTRSSRYNIGPWFAWWGFRDNNLYKDRTPLFDTAYCRMAHLSIIPQEGLTPHDYPQNYDQEGVECDFRDMASGPPPPVPADAKFKKDAFPGWDPDLATKCKYSRKMDDVE